MKRLVEFDSELVTSSKEYCWDLRLKIKVEFSKRDNSRWKKVAAGEQVRGKLMRKFAQTPPLIIMLQDEADWETSVGLTVELAEEKVEKSKMYSGFFEGLNRASEMEHLLQLGLDALREKQTRLFAQLERNREEAGVEEMDIDNINGSEAAAVFDETAREVDLDDIPDTVRELLYSEAIHRSENYETSPTHSHIVKQKFIETPRSREIRIGEEVVSIPSDALDCEEDADAIAFQGVVLETMKKRWEDTPPIQRKREISEGFSRSAKSSRRSLLPRFGHVGPPTDEELIEKQGGKTKMEKEFQLIADEDKYDEETGFPLRFEYVADINFSSLKMFQEAFSSEIVTWPFLHIEERAKDSAVVYDGLNLFETCLVFLEELTYGAVHSANLKTRILSWKAGKGKQPLTSIHAKFGDLASLVESVCRICGRHMNLVTYVGAMRMPIYNYYRETSCAGPIKRFIIASGLLATAEDRKELFLRVLQRMETIANLRMDSYEFDARFVNTLFMCYGGFLSLS